ncbi:MAG: BlaI/MecI/CopY family transcriptional regulator [Planctomycetaceae bacterium]|nr:BlaI/MecI/CopY family transcriptional regulator [Planctomycetaceae bacterium]
MARQELASAPSEREMDILKVFWNVGEAPVRTIHQIMAPNGEFALTTIQTLVRIMAEKGFLQVRNVNRTLYYKPNYTIEQAGSRFLHKVFDGAVDRLVLSMLQAENLSADELREIEKLIAKERVKKQKG